MRHPDLAWLGPDGKKPLMGRSQCQNSYVIYLDGRDEPSEFGDYRLLFILNANY